MKTKSWIESHIPYLTAALFVVQPLMDILSYWFQEWGISSLPTLALRMGLLGVTVILAFLLSDRKRVYFIAAGVIVFIALGHVWACSQIPGGYQSPIADLTNYIRVIQMPVTVLCLITFLRRDERSFEYMQLGLTLALTITLLVEVLSTITGTDPSTYSDGLGILGWFNNTNSQSSNLSILVPVSLAWQLTRKNRNMILFWLTTILGCGALFYFGTRLAYLGIYAACIGLSFTLFLVRRSDWKVATALLAIAILFTALMPVSPMMRHMRVDNGTQSERQGYINKTLGDNLDEVKTIIKKNNSAKSNSSGNKKEHDGKNPGEEEDTGMTEAERRRLVRQLTPVYRFYVRDFVEIFGAEKTMEMFNYSIDIHDFSAVRAKKLMFAQMLMNDSPASSKIFGLNLARFTVGENIYDVENDFHGIYYLYGLVGLLAYLLFLAYFVYLVIWALIKNARQYFTVQAASYGIALLMCIAHAYNTAGVLRRPNASIYLSAILAGIYYLVRIKKYDALPPKTRRNSSCS